MLEVNVQVLKEGNDMLLRRKDELVEEKTEAEQRREQLRTECKAKDDIAAKRLQTRLNREKT